MRDDCWYDTAQICLNGHVVNKYSVSSPEHNSDFCPHCGEKTINCCKHCACSIRGYYHVPGFLDLTGDYDRPSFCYKCGKPYPWTQRTLDAARELSDELDNLNEDEKELLKKSLDDIVRDTAKTTVAATRLKKLVAKAGKGASEGFKAILISVATEAAKKMIWPRT